MNLSKFPGLDMGGLTKEWFLLLCKKIFDADYGMFNYNKESGTYWFNTVQFENYQEYNLVGVLMGLAVYNSTILDIRYENDTDLFTLLRSNCA